MTISNDDGKIFPDYYKHEPNHWPNPPVDHFSGQFWKPIEHAPKDGRIIVGWSSVYEAPVLVRYASPGHYGLLKENPEFGNWIDTMCQNYWSEEDISLFKEYPDYLQDGPTPTKWEKVRVKSVTKTETPRGAF